MKTSDVDLLLCVEGRSVSDDHWVGRWARNLKTGVLIDIGPPGGEEGRLRTKKRVSEAVSKAERPVVLVGYHSGVAAIVMHAADGAVGIKGALLVAPPNLKLIEDAELAKQSETAITNAPLPFPSLVVASRTDPRCSYDKASELALAWGSHLVDAGDAGQLDVSSGHGPWPEGLMRLGWFLKRLQ